MKLNYVHCNLNPIFNSKLSFKIFFIAIFCLSNKFFVVIKSPIPFGVDLLFTDNKNLTFGVEICEDLWAINPPSSKISFYFFDCQKPKMDIFLLFYLNFLIFLKVQLIYF
jgi:hypothetical protein